MTLTQKSSSSPLMEFDVIVIGGGPSGAHAAIAAARLGASVLLVEKHGFLGGSLTAMGVGPMMSFHNPSGKQVVKGQAQELVERLMSAGASPGHIADTTTYCATVTPFDSEALKIELETMVTEVGGQLLYHTHFAKAWREGSSVSAVQFCNKAGLQTYRAKVFIDATGDGDLSAALGAPFSKGREGDGLTQPMTMNMKVGNVDTDRLRSYVYDHPDDFHFTLGAEEGLRRLRQSDRISLGAFVKTWEAAKERGLLADVPRENVLMFETGTPGVFIINTSRIQGLDATNPFDLTRAEMIGRRQNLQIFQFLRNECAGFENAIRMDGAAQVGVREGRRIEGLYTLTGDDLLTGKSFPDCIALGGYPIDIHSPTPDSNVTNTRHLDRDTIYQIPMRSLLTREPDNLVLAGRCLSATHEAMAAVRVSPIMMAVGQAAGTIAAIAAEANVPTCDVDFRRVRDTLRMNGAALSTDK